MLNTKLMQLVVMVDILIILINDFTINSHNRVEPILVGIKPCRMFRI